MTHTSTYRLARGARTYIAYDLRGPETGSLVLCVPGMGETRSGFGPFATLLAQEGYRVACMDLRGHGDSSVDFPNHSDASTADDIVALIGALGGQPTVLVGNSLGAAAAVIAATTQPSLVSALVLLGPFVRDGNHPILTKAFLQALFARPWGLAAWRRYYKTLAAAPQSEQTTAHQKSALATVAEPGRFTALKQFALNGHAESGRRVENVTQPTLIIMGAADPDFRSPETEAAWIADHTGGTAVLLPDTGHYPQYEQPTKTANAVVTFLTAKTSVAE